MPDELSPAHDSAWLIALPAYADASNRSAEADFPILLDNLDNLDFIHDIIIYYPCYCPIDDAIDDTHDIH